MNCKKNTTPLQSCRLKHGDAHCSFSFGCLESLSIQFSALNELISKPVIEENSHLPLPYVDFIFKYFPLKDLQLIKVAELSAHKIWQAEQRISGNIIFSFESVFFISSFCFISSSLSFDYYMAPVGNFEPMQSPDGTVICELLPLFLSFYPC